MANDMAQSLLMSSPIWIGLTRLSVDVNKENRGIYNPCLVTRESARAGFVPGAVLIPDLLFLEIVPLF